MPELLWEKHTRKKARVAGIVAGVLGLALVWTIGWIFIPAWSADAKDISIVWMTAAVMVLFSILAVLGIVHEVSALADRRMR